VAYACINLDDIDEFDWDDSNIYKNEKIIYENAKKDTDF